MLYSFKCVFHVDLIFTKAIVDSHAILTDLYDLSSYPTGNVDVIHILFFQFYMDFKFYTILSLFGGLSINPLVEQVQTYKDPCYCLFITIPISPAFSYLHQSISKILSFQKCYMNGIIITFWDYLFHLAKSQKSHYF